MGNLVATISWKPRGDIDDQIIRKLSEMAKNRGINTTTDVNYGKYVGKKSKFVVDISGVWLAYDRDGSRITLEEYCKDCKVMLQSMKVENICTYIDDLAI